MDKDLELWRFIAHRLGRSEPVGLLIVAESSGSSPGRAGYKMAVGLDGGLYGSIGGGVMEVGLVEGSRNALLNDGSDVLTFSAVLKRQVHRLGVPDASGMICSGRQAVIAAKLGPNELPHVEQLIQKLSLNKPAAIRISPLFLEIPDLEFGQRIGFELRSESDFVYEESLGAADALFIIGGGHCALALSELASKLGFRIHVIDDRPDINTIEKNRFADEVTVIETYERIGDRIPHLRDAYVVVMTLGYAFDRVVIRELVGRDFIYFGVLGSKAKMKVLLRELAEEGISHERLAKIRTPIGIPINSRTPVEIAVSIAAEMIAVRNGGSAR